MKRVWVLVAAFGLVGLGTPDGAQAFWKKAHWKKAGATLKKVGKKIKKGLKKAGKKIKGALKKAGQALKSWGKKARNALSRAARNAAAWVKKQTRKISYLWKNIMPQFPDAGVRFRLPMEKPSEFGSSVIWHVDTVKGKLGGAICRNYRGAWGVLSCYGGHKGTDYRLKGGFKSMDDLRKGWVVAAAGGTVTNAVHSNFDRCTALDIKAFFTKGAVGVTCKGEKYNGDKHHANNVVLLHKPDLRTRYFHLKKGSIPWLAKYQAAKNAGREFQLKCGDRIGLAGSSGMSSFPHLHFQVERKDSAGNWIPVDPYKGKYSQKYSYWVDQNRAGKLPSTRCQR